MNIDNSLINSLDFFADLLPKEKEKLIPLIHILHINEGEEFISLGAPAQTFYIILSGNYMVYFENGKAFTLHYKGDIVGWSTLISPFKYVGTVIALTNGEALTLSAQDFRQVIQCDTVLGSKIMKKIYTIMEQRTPFFKEKD